MKSKHLLLTLLLALLVPWAANAQEQETLTVCDGTTTNARIPVYGLYTDTPGTTSEFIIPAETEGMSDMEGGTISKVTFYISEIPATWGSPVIQLYLGEVDGTTLSSLYGPNNFTVVKTMVWSNQQSTIEVEFDEPYTYEGGNLLIGTYVQTKGGYKTTYFYGVTGETGCSRYNSGSGSGTAQDFLPKTTFEYTPAQQGGDVCEKPATCEASDVTHNSATLTWTGGSGTYNVEVKGGAWTDWTEILHETTLTTTNLNLQPITAYQARVQSVCTGETPTSSWKSTSFTTECGPVGIGYQCGFEGPYTGSYPLPACWTRTGTSTNYPYAYNYGSHLGSYCLYFSGKSSTNASAMLPEIEGGVNGKRLSFYLKVSNAAVSMSVGYLNGENTFVEVESVAPTTTNSYQLMEVDFANIEGNPTNMVLKFKSTASSTYSAYIDDLELQETPPCADMQVQASTITATATAYNAATVTWTGAGAATQWKVQCSQDNTFATVDKEVVANTTTANITGLTAETTYYVRIAPFCTENSEYNPWSSNKSFSTPVSCPAPVLAAATNLTAHGATFTWTGTSETYNLMRCTPEYQTGGITEGFENGLGEWEKRNCASSTGISTTISHENSGHSFRFYYNTNPPQYLISPELTGIEAGTVQFYYRKTESMSETFKVGYSTTTKETSAFGNWSEEQSASTSWQLFSMDIPAGTKYVCIQYTANDHYYLYIDDITIGNPQTIPATPWQTVETGITANTVTVSDDTKFDAETKYQVKVVGICPWTSEETDSNVITFTTSSSCETPSNLQESEVTENSAKISWDGHGLSEFNLRYGTDGTTWTTVENVANPYTLDGVLESNKAYQVQVQATCNTEEWSTVLNFTTECGPISLATEPYQYGFETAPEFNCWTVATGSSVTRYNYSDNAHLGSYYLRFNGTQENVIEMPSFEQATNTLRLEYWVRPESYTNSSCGSFAIGYYNANNEFVALKTYAYNSTTYKYDGWESSTYIKERIDFDVDADNDGTPDVPDNANIVLRQFNTTSNWYWFVDDVKVKVIPTCEDVNDVHYVSFTNHSATIAWTADAAQAAWQIAYKAGANFNPNNAEELATATIVNVTSNPYLFDKNLEAETTYYMYVRGNCTASSNGYGDWSDSYATFTTLAATPAPSNFTASNFGSQTADLVWTAGGGDYELSWDLYYLKSDDAPEVPTATTDATKTVTTLPTTEAPYQLTGLDPESRYYIWVRANHTINSVTTHSAWVALTGNYFTTIAACSAMDPVVSNITHHNATVNWNGESQDGFTVNYRTSGSIDPENAELVEGFEHNGSMPTDWTHIGSGSWTINSTSARVHVGSYSLRFSGATSDNVVVLPDLGVESNTLLISFWSLAENGSYSGTFQVGYVTDATDASTFHTVGNYQAKDQLEYTHVENISLASAPTGARIAFRHTSASTSYWWWIDDVLIGAPTGFGAWQDQAATTTTTDLTGLTAGTKYDLKVVPNCDATQESATVQFTTLDGNTKYFLTEGDWATAANWMDEEMPALTDNAIIKANATINNGTVAAAKKITFQGSPTPTLTINDGGQLQTDNTVTATVKKTITGYESTNDRYYLIGNPLSSSITVSQTDNTYNIRKGTYDLYSWSRTSNLEWTNNGSTYTSSVYMYNGTGYLYASDDDRVITFTGTVKANNTDVTVTPSYDAPTETQEFKDWNLYANPFVCNAYLNDANENLAFYRMNPTTGAGFIVATGAIAPMEGIFVQATDANQTFKFSRNQIANNSRGQLNINLSKAATRGASLADNAIIRFGEGNLLEKFCFSNNSSKVYIPMEGKDYAVVNAESNVGEIPVSFEAKNNGTYTLSFTNEEVSFAYLHLIDNMTGIETDLLANPSYTFEARTTDYASRFKLVFATGSSTGSDTFAYYSNGNWVINNEGRATLQVVDVNGRILKSESINGCANVNFKAAAGIYMIRLVNGDNVKVQKVVVR